jgi:2-amino-4-hydroxy-6-hydroxymethyldihydropteridine diphosphokinase
VTAARVTAYVGIGANLGDARASVENAFQQLAALPDTRLTGQSSLFRTAPIDAGGDDYVNAVVRIETPLPADELLKKLQEIEHASGRVRSVINAPRTLDLDILLYGTLKISSESLTVPHPRLTQRAFVLIPLLQIDPLIAIPGKGPAHEYVQAVAGQVICRI